MSKCVATKKNGDPCQYEGKEWYAGYCGIHFPKAFKGFVGKDSEQSTGEARRWGWIEIISVSSGGLALAQFVVNMFGSVNGFGYGTLARSIPDYARDDSCAYLKERIRQKGQYCNEVPILGLLLDPDDVDGQRLFEKFDINR